MGNNRFMDEQMSFALRQGESGRSVAESIRKLGISKHIFYRWKKRFTELDAAELRRLPALEEESKRLKQ